MMMAEPKIYAPPPREWYAHRIKKDMCTITLYENGEMYYYADGVYAHDPQGNHHKEYLRELMGQRHTSSEANEILNLVRVDTFRPMVDFNDVDPYELCVNNGIIDLRTGAFSQHTPDKLHLWKLPIEYDPTATAPVLMKFLSEILYPQDIDVVQEMMGYMLFGRCAYRKAFMLIGKGMNGKSVLIDFIIAMIGEQNVSSISLQKLEENQFACSRLFGKAANICDELSKEALKKLDVFKKLVSGSLIDAEKKGKDGFDFYNKAKMLFATNDPPVMYDNSDGNWDRWIFLTFPNQFTEEAGNRDVHLREKLITQQELAGGLNYAIEGVRRLFANDKFSCNRSTDEVRQKYVMMSDPISAFVDAHVEYTGMTDDFIPKDAFERMVSDFCLENNLTPPTRTMIGKRLPHIIDGTGKTNPEINGRRVPSWKCITSDRFDMNGYVLRGSRAEPTKEINARGSGLDGFQ